MLLKHLTQLCQRVHEHEVDDEEAEDGSSYGRKRCAPTHVKLRQWLLEYINIVESVLQPTLSCVPTWILLFLIIF